MDIFARLLIPTTTYTDFSEEMCSTFDQVNTADHGDIRLSRKRGTLCSGEIRRRGQIKIVEALHMRLSEEDFILVEQ